MLISIVSPELFTASAGTTYAYNGLNQLTSVSGIFNGTLAYDPANRLYQLISGASTTRFQYAGTSLMAEFDGANAMLRRYVHGSGTDEPLVWYEGSGTTNRRFLQADERGSIIAVSDSAGASLGINRFDEYGIPQTGNLGRFSYTGQTALPEIGLLYYKARMYAPGLGRFMQTDPIGYGDGLNWYNYVGSDPVNATDPSGLCTPATGTRICSDSRGTGSSGSSGNGNTRPSGFDGDQVIIGSLRRRGYTITSIVCVGSYQCSFSAIRTYSSAGGFGGLGFIGAELLERGLPQSDQPNPFCAQAVKNLRKVDAAANKIGGAATDLTFVFAISALGDIGPAEATALVAGAAQGTSILTSLGKGIATNDYRQFAVRALTGGGGSIFKESRFIKAVGGDVLVDKIGQLIESIGPEPQCPARK